MTEDRLRSRAILWALALACGLASLVMAVWVYLAVMEKPIPSELWQLVTIIVNGVTIAGIFKLIEKQP